MDVNLDVCFDCMHNIFVIYVSCCVSFTTLFNSFLQNRRGTGKRKGVIGLSWVTRKCRCWRETSVMTILTWRLMHIEEWKNIDIFFTLYAFSYYFWTIGVLLPWPVLEEFYLEFEVSYFCTCLQSMSMWFTLLQT